ncbi:phosphatidylglycerophosphate synthase [Halomonas campaniensis]|uniref:Phosphatidylglycerophosphate synthase n=1 Tax=Halomonas campaniensis TaxID=213554 RepID=A0A7W5PD65_9GAMM|nr:CDP-alcohol phosphatidyltransferase family protein [Halomonas campaniensis]MBB3332691.1 phosphatidylglycerophosphate synthase [Halomonas campaniensis]
MPSPVSSHPPEQGPAEATRPWRLAMELALGGLALLGLLLLLMLLASGTDSAVSPRVAPLAIVTYLGMATLLWRALRRGPRAQAGLGPANRATLARGVLVALLAGTLADSALLAARGEWLFALALVALALDGVDGWVARRTASASAVGARFDMELDAFFILVLCLALLQLERVGPWVLAIGAMRYVFVAASWRWPWLAGELPESQRRKAVCVWQVAALMLALLPAMSDLLAGWLAATALAGLTLSFAVDVRWLYRHR